VSRAVGAGARVMVASSAPIVAGNDPGQGRRGAYTLVAFLGQADVRVRGRVAAGDYLVPSGLDDGTAVALRASTARAEDLRHVLGQAWERSAGPGLGRVRALVGVSAAEPMAHVLAGLRARLEALEREQP
jgi:hypothetical protein